MNEKDNEVIVKEEEKLEKRGTSKKKSVIIDVYANRKVIFCRYTIFCQTFYQYKEEISHGKKNENHGR